MTHGHSLANAANLGLVNALQRRSCRRIPVEHLHSCGRTHNQQAKPGGQGSCDHPCTPCCGYHQAVLQMSSNTGGHMFVIVSAEIGHNMGLSHDGVKNADGTVTGYYSGHNGW